MISQFYPMKNARFDDAIKLKSEKYNQMGANRSMWMVLFDYLNKHYKDKV